MGKQWALLAFALIILHVLLFASWMLIGTVTRQSLTPVAIVMILYAVLFAAIVVVFCRRVNRAADPILYREARAYGLPATAKVLEIERTRWRVRRSCNFRLQFRPQRCEYRMWLRITGVGALDYETDMAEYLSGADVPERGDLIGVKVHPLYPDIVVLSRDGCPPPFWGCTDFC